MAQFEGTRSENLIKHTNSGVYYLSAKVNGKKFRQSLKTSVLKTALLRRNEKVRLLRLQGDSKAREKCGTIDDALEIVLLRHAQDVSTRKSTRGFYAALGKALRKCLPLKAREWSADEQRAWWKKITAGKSSAFANNCLGVVRSMVTAARDAGMHVEACPLRRMPGKRLRASVLPSKEEFARLVASIRERQKAHSTEAADMVEFLAWSGLRIAELRALCWEDVGEKWITVRGGADGTKSGKVRRLPISAPLAEVLQKRFYNEAAGAVFVMVSPREALGNACERLGIAHVRVHDLRHLFATRCIEAGVDIPTVAKWLGHSDGGALAMRVYGHLRDDHSLSSAKLLLAGVAGAVEG